MAARACQWLQVGALFISLPRASSLAAGAEQAKTPSQDNVYSHAATGTYNVPPELKNFRLFSSTPMKLGNARAVGHNPRKWQSDPSRIICHNGKYHCCMIDGYPSLSRPMGFTGAKRSFVRKSTCRRHARQRTLAPTLGKYVGITRTWGKQGRQVARTESDDFFEMD
jgi:hypothetical protein